MAVYGIKDNKCFENVKLDIHFVDAYFPTGPSLNEQTSMTVDVTDLGLTADNYVVVGFAWRTDFSAGSDDKFIYSPMQVLSTGSNLRVVYPIFEVNYETHQATIALHIVNSALVNNDDPLTCRVVILKYA